MQLESSVHWYLCTLTLCALPTVCLPLHSIMCFTTYKCGGVCCCTQQHCLSMNESLVDPSGSHICAPQKELYKGKENLNSSELKKGYYAAE